MKRKVLTTLAMLAMVVGSMVVFAAPAQASISPHMLRSNGNGLCLGSNTTGTDVFLEPCDRYDYTQRWAYLNLGYGTGTQLYRSNANGGNSGLCLTHNSSGSLYLEWCSGEYDNNNWAAVDAVDYSTNVIGEGCSLLTGSNGAVLCAWPGNPGKGDPNRVWHFTDSAGPGGPWTFQNSYSNKCLEVPGYGTSNGNWVDQYFCNGGSHQKWYMRIRGGGYELVNQNSGKCLDAGWSTDNGVATVQWDCHGGADQQWREIYDPGTGRYYLQNVHSGKCLDVPNYSTSDGTRIIMWDCNRQANQAWY